MTLGTVGDMVNCPHGHYILSGGSVFCILQIFSNNITDSLYQQALRRQLSRASSQRMPGVGQRLANSGQVVEGEGSLRKPHLSKE